MVNKMAELFWTTKDGVKMLPSEMSDQHLANAIALVRKNFPGYCIRLANQMEDYADDAPEGAAYAASGGAMRLYELAEDFDEDDIAETKPIFGAMLAEQKRRERT